MRRQKPKPQPLPPHVRITLLAITILVTFFWAWLAGTIFQTIDARKAARPSQTPSAAPDLPEPSPSTPLPVIENREQGAASLLLVGDVMLGRYVETLMKKNGDDYPFAKLDGLLDGYDLVIGNLEGPVVRNQRQTPDNSLIFSFPVSTATVLAERKFTHVSVANNHGLDQGTAGVAETRAAFTAVGITSFGHPSAVRNEDAAVTVVNSHEVVLIGFQAVSSSFQSEEARTLIAAVRSERPAAFIIIFPHWGSEYQTTSSKRQRGLAHDWIDAGADAVIGHHPHVVQESEIYRGKMIVYSLGNFIFDQYFSIETQRGLAVAIVLNEAEVAYTFHPLVSERSQPRPMTESETAAWVSAYQQQSPTVTFTRMTVTLDRPAARE